MYSFIVLEARSPKSVLIGWNSSVGRAWIFWRVWGEYVPSPFPFCCLPAFLSLWLYHSHLPPRSCDLVLSVFSQLLTVSDLLCLLIVRLHVIAFRVTIIQDNLPVSRSLSQLHLQRPLFHIRWNLQMPEVRMWYLCGEHFSACHNQYFKIAYSFTIQFSSVAQSCSTLCDPMDGSTPGLPVHHQLPESTQTHVHQVNDAIQPSHPMSSPSPSALNLFQHQGLFQWISSSHQVAKVLEFQPQHQSFQWTPKTDL